MKYILKIILLVIVTITIVSTLIVHEPPGDPILNLITKDEVTEEIEYVSICSNRKLDKIDKFTSDAIEIYNGNSQSFVSYVSENKIYNKANAISLKDSNGHAVDNHDIIKGIVASAENIKHSILDLQIIKLNDDYFALVKLNVNLHSPCDFYEYDKTEKELKLLYGFESVDIIGLSYPTN